MKKSLSTLFFLLWPTLASGATIQGVVTDTTGSRVQGAFVFFFDTQAVMTIDAPVPGKSALTDRAGNYPIVLPPGYYNACVFSAGFTPTCKTMLLSEKIDNVVSNVVLALDPVFVKTMGDTFHTH